MREMTFEIRYAGKKSTHRVVYIEYHGKIPFSVVTDEKSSGDAAAGLQGIQVLKLVVLRLLTYSHGCK